MADYWLERSNWLVLVCMGDQMNAIFSIGAEPVDLQAAHLLWKSPWWAKALESMEVIEVTPRDFITALGRLYYDFTNRERRALSLGEFAELASMARKVRWKNISGNLSPKLMMRRLACLKWNPSIARFEVEPNPCLKTNRSIDREAIDKMIGDALGS